ncbi:MAG: XdhC family protein [Candidatus Promineifilaceae bacterium]
MSARDGDSALIRELLAAQEAGRALALATVVRARGSAPRGSGAKMLIYEDGQTSGTVGGGEMEARVRQEALAALRDGRPRLLPYSLVDPARGDPGVCGGEVEIYVEPYRLAATVVVIGCGHVGRAVVHLAGWLGFHVVANDDRSELVTPEMIPGADEYVPGSIQGLLEAVPMHADTYIVVVTRNVLVDRQLLPHLAASRATYIGVIGSRRRWEETKRLLIEDGLNPAELGRFHSPIGLELHAETPAEIAVSILAEIILLRRGSQARGQSGARQAAPARMAEL